MVKLISLYCCHCNDHCSTLILCLRHGEVILKIYCGSQFSDQIMVQDVTHEMLPPSSSTSVPTVQMVSSPAPPAATSTIAVTPVVSRSSSSAVTPSNAAGMQVSRDSQGHIVKEILFETCTQ